MRPLVALTLPLVLLVGCHLHPAVKSSSPDRDEVMLGSIKQLAGTWNGSDMDGKTIQAATFSVTSGGSAVREVMFPGKPYEMTNVYHMDGDKLVLTHYCYAGNQPTMIAASAVDTDEGKVFQFDFDHVSNLRADHPEYMGAMTLTIRNDGEIRQDWRSYDRDGKLSEEATTIDLTRAR